MTITTINGYNLTLSEAIEMFGMTPLVLLISGLLLAVVAIAFVIFLGIWTYNDAKERTNEPVLWTLLVLFIPMPFGLIIYLLAGRNKTGQSTNRYLKPLIVSATTFVLSLSVVIGSAIHLIVLLAQNGMLNPIMIGL